MREDDKERTRRVALALLLRRHLLEYPDEIKAAYLKAKADGALPERNVSRKRRRGAASAKKKGTAKVNGVKASTALAQLIGYDDYDNDTTGKPEAARHLFEFMQSGASEHYQKAYDYFATVVTPDYRAKAPLYVQLAIYEVFERPPENDGAQAVAPEEPAYVSHHRRSPPALISSIEETLPRFTRRAQVFDGTWNVIRYSHTGHRVVRLALQVEQNGFGRRVFKLYFRTREMTTGSDQTARFTTHGSLIVLKGGDYVFFFGQEEAQPGDATPDGYPLSIICPTRIVSNGPFIGLVKRRHDEGVVFAIKAQFIRAEEGATLDKLLGQKRIGSWETEQEIAENMADIPNWKTLLEQLTRDPQDRRGGLVLGSKHPS